MVDQAGAVRTEEGVVRRGVLGGEGEALPEGAADGGPVVGVVDAARPGRAPVAAVATWAATVGVPVRVAAHSGREPTHRDARSPPRPTRASPSNQAVALTRTSPDPLIHSSPTPGQVRRRRLALHRAVAGSNPSAPTDRPAPLRRL
jgi:hypothetical protein